MIVKNKKVCPLVDAKFSTGLELVGENPTKLLKIILHRLPNASILHK